MRLASEAEPTRCRSIAAKIGSGPPLAPAGGPQFGVLLMGAMPCLRRLDEQRPGNNHTSGLAGGADPDDSELPRLCFHFGP
jgi:hypothetical protein